MSRIYIGDGPDGIQSIQLQLIDISFLACNGHVTLFLDDKTADEIVFKLGSKLQDLERQKKT